METFLSSLSNELFKLRRRKKYLVFLILGCAICVISALRVLLVNYLTDGSVDPAAVLGGLMSSNLTFILLIFLPLMAVMAASDLFVAEQADHTIRFPSCARWERGSSSSPRPWRCLCCAPLTWR